MGRPSEVVVVSVLFVLLGLLWIGLGFGLSVLYGLASPKAGASILLICSVIGIFFCIIAIGLLKLQGWAHTLAIIFSGIGLIHFPVGTALGAICLWLLLKSEVKQAFGES